jgi:glycerol dehydrogenase
LNDSVEAVIEATVLLSGVSFESGGLSLAHALIRGLTSIPNMAAMLHGDLVAFGTLVQVVYEQRPEDEMAELIALLNGVHLPITLAQLGQLEPVTEQDMNVIVEATLAAKYSRNMKPALTAPLLAAAIRQADAIGQAASSKNHR